MGRRRACLNFYDRWALIPADVPSLVTPKLISHNYDLCQLKHLIVKCHATLTFFLALHLFSSVSLMRISHQMWDRGNRKTNR